MLRNSRLWSALGWKAVAELLSRVFGFIFLFYSARQLGDAGFGAYALPLAWGGLWALVLDWGTHQYLIRALAEGADPEVVLPSAARLKVLSSLCFLTGMALTGWYLPELNSSHLMAAALWLMAQSWNDAGFSLLNAYERFKAEAIYRNGLRFGLLLPQLLVLTFFPRVDVLLWSSALVQIVLCLGFWGALMAPYAGRLRQRCGGQLAHEGPSTLSALLRLWREGLGFWWTNVAWLVYLKLDLVMLPRLWAGTGSLLAVVGWYQGAVRLYEVLALGGYIVGQALYPRWVKMPLPQRQHAWRRLLLFFWPLAAAFALLAYGLAPTFVPLLLGASFVPAVALLQVLCLSLPFVMFNQIALPYVAVHHRQGRGALITAGCVLLNAGLNAWGIPRYGATAAAWSTVAADLALSLGLLALMSRRDFQQTPHKQAER